MLSSQSLITGALEQRSSYHALQTSLDQESPNYTLITYTDGLASPLRSLVIETLVSLLTLGKPSPRSLGSNKICPLRSTLKLMDFPSGKTNGLNNISTLLLPLTRKTGLTGLLLCQQYTTIGSTQPLAYHPMKSSLATPHVWCHQK